MKVIDTGAIISIDEILEKAAYPQYRVTNWNVTFKVDLEALVNSGQLTVKDVREYLDGLDN